MNKFKNNIRRVLKKYQDMSIFESTELTSFDQCSVFDEDCPIHWASRNGHLEDLKLMIETNIDVNIKGDIGNTPLHEAVSNNHKEIIKELIENGADPTIKNDYGDLPVELSNETSTKEFLLELVSKYQRKK